MYHKFTLKRVGPLKDPGTEPAGVLVVKVAGPNMANYHGSSSSPGPRDLKNMPGKCMHMSKIHKGEIEKGLWYAPSLAKV